MDGEVAAPIEEHLRAGRYREAFELIVQQFGPKVYRLACSLGNDEALAEDAAQEVLVRVWRALPRFEGRSSVSTWIYAITRNLCLTRAARRAADEIRRSRLAAVPDHAGRQPPSEYDLEQALARLPPHYRRVLVLFYYEGKSYEAVAEALGLPLGTVKTHLNRARKRLRAALEEQHEKSFELR
jgi:RNA polymerase sigma-70 factor (ECF subfamily)